MSLQQQLSVRQARRTAAHHGHGHGHGGRDRAHSHGGSPRDRAAAAVGAASHGPGVQGAVQLALAEPSYSYDYDNMQGPEQRATPRVAGGAAGLQQSSSKLKMTESQGEDLLRQCGCFWPDSEDTARSLRHCFLMFDKDGDGSIGPDELGSVLNNLGENATDEEVNGMLVAADEDGSGEITFDEFYKVMTGVQVRTKALPFCCASTVFLSKTAPLFRC
eukprot:SAG22_NODE_1162_length_5301_cov_1.628604_9_plen_218_part_00